jgi:hypothetical protein
MENNTPMNIPPIIIEVNDEEENVQDEVRVNKFPNAHK